MSKLKSLRVSLFGLALLAMPMTSALGEDAHHPSPSNSAVISGAGPSKPASAMEAMMGRSSMNKGGMMRHGAAGSPAGSLTFLQMMGMGEATVRYIEGQLAFLRAELKLSEVQVPLWNDFANAVRMSARDRNQALDAETNALSRGQTGALNRLEQHENVLSTRLAGVRAVRTALDPLHSALTDDQKKSFEELMSLRLPM